MNYLTAAMPEAGMAAVLPFQSALTKPSAFFIAASVNLLVKPKNLRYNIR